MNSITICGSVVRQPIVKEDVTEFLLLTGYQTLTVIRTDLHWQKRDILFLDEGQLVEVCGCCEAAESNCIHAQTITIITCPKGLQGEA